MDTRIPQESLTQLQKSVAQGQGPSSGCMDGPHVGSFCIQMEAAWTLLLPVLIAWKLLCISLRKQRAQSLASLDPLKDAYKLNWAVSFVELPYITHKALEFALFRTYAIPSISSVLQQTGKLEASAAKRADDTEILIKEMMLHHVDSDRGSYALRRLNFIHGHYKISNDDYLYTLALFVLQPSEWGARFGYRTWTEAEKLATFTMWHDIGVRMGIKSIPSTLEELSNFRDEYEMKHMVFAKSNQIVADATVELLLGTVPGFMKPVARRAVYALLDDRLREAFGYPKQHVLLRYTAEILLRFVTGIFVSMFMPPRPFSMAYTRVPKNNSTKLDPNALSFLSCQVYMPASYPNGYKLSEVGPFKPGKIGNAFHGDLLCPFDKNIDI